MTALASNTEKPSVNAKSETPFLNSRVKQTLSEEFELLRKKIQAIEAVITEEVQTSADRGKESLDSASKSVSKSARKALVNLAGELENAAKRLRKKAKE